ncbi:hypothetical protein V5O48_018805 [Marasmius crinis-equi]|uniref:Uncharacterized protein n=1 Tax=Marasmius crinis-equi TaxID=585013 RepID=A0ABR3EK47_9AGAR
MVECGSVAIPSAKIQASVKIKIKPLQLLAGKAAHQKGEAKFDAHHLPDFITKNSGYRKTFAPLAKELFSHIHLWTSLKPSMVQSFVDRGWGAGRVIILSSGKDKDVVTTLARNKVTNLHHEMSTVTFAALEEFFESHSSTTPAPANPDDEPDWVFRSTTDRAKFARYMTSKYCLSDKHKAVVSPMHFCEFLAEISDNGKDTKIVSKQGMFKHLLILKVLGSYLSYVKAIPSGIQRLEGKPFGALEIAIQAVEWALTFYHTGESTLDLMSSDHHFSYINWGSQLVKDAVGEDTGKLCHKEFHSSIKKFFNEKWKVILKGARKYITTKCTGKATKKNQKAADPEEAREEEEDDDDDIVMSDPPEPVTNGIVQTVLQVTGDSEDMAGEGNGVCNLNNANDDGDGRKDKEEGSGHENVEGGDATVEENDGDDSNWDESNIPDDSGNAEVEQNDVGNNA